MPPASVADDLILSEERLRLALNASQIGFYDWNIETNIIHFSSQMRSDWGLKDYLINSLEDAIALIHPDDQERVKIEVDESVQKSKPYQIEYRVIRPVDNQTVWFEVKGEVNKNADGVPTRFIGTCIDINDRKLTEQKLKVSEARFRKFAEAMPQMVFVADSDGNMTYFNRRHYNYFGVDQLEDEGWAWKEQNIHHPDDFSRTIEAWTEALKTKKPYQIEYRLKRHDGDYRWHLGRAEPVLDENGNVILWIGTNTDISDLRSSQEQLIESEAKFRTITDAMPQMVWSTLPDGHHDYFNKRWYEYTGVPVGSTDGEGWNDIFHPEDQERAMQVWQSSLRSGTPYQIEYRLRHHSGDYRWTLGRALPIRNSQGEVIRWMGTCTDIHEQKHIALELAEAKSQAERASQTKSKFLANMSHEIRSPMNSVLGYADLLTESTISDMDRINYATRIQRSGEHLLNIIDDILDLSKVEAGYLSIEKSHFKIVDLVLECVDSLSILAAKKNLKIRVSFSSPVPSRIESDAGRIRQIVTNLISNSIKFTDQGSIEVALGFEDADNDKQAQFIIEVKDTGIGIPSEQQGHLFQPFTQADSSITRKYGGTGLGLNLSQHLARTLGGDLTLNWSEPNRGSSFKLSVACGDIRSVAIEAHTDEDKNNALITNSETRSNSENLRVLIVDDSPDNLALMKVYLKKGSSLIETASNGQEAIDKALKADFDIVLMDIQMPLLDGLEATRKLRALGFKKPIIALTAHALKEEVDKSIQAGCNAHLAKPVSRKELVDVIIKQTLSASN